jgi:hypothetical protein
MKIWTGDWRTLVTNQLPPGINKYRILGKCEKGKKNKKVKKKGREKVVRLKKFIKKRNRKKEKRKWGNVNRRRPVVPTRS